MDKGLKILLIIGMVVLSGCIEVEERGHEGQLCFKSGACYEGLICNKERWICERWRGDAGVDAGRDVEIADTLDIGDVFVDVEDVWVQDTNPDGELPDIEGDAITDIITDISQDAGGDITLNLKYNSIYDMSAGKVSTDDYKVRSVTGTNAGSVINIDGMKVYKNKSHKK